MIINGDCLEVMKTMSDNCVDSIVCDPPYELGFLGNKWDGTGIANSVELWKEALRVLKPGGHLLAFGGSRTYHRMTCAIEDAGFEIRDCLEWIYASGFPKSNNIGKSIDKLQGNKRTKVKDITTHDIRSNGLMDKKGYIGVAVTQGSSIGEGWGTGLKPAHEPIVLARKPITESTIAKNFLKWGTGGINIDECRVDNSDMKPSDNKLGREYRLFADGRKPNGMKVQQVYSPFGRFPANLILDDGECVRKGFPNSKSSVIPNRKRISHNSTTFCNNGGSINDAYMGGGYSDNGSAARFFYCAKTSKAERNMGCEDLEEKLVASPGDVSAGKLQKNAGNGKPNSPILSKNNHPTVKPLSLMRYLITLVTPPNGTVLDPFCGSGSTGIAAYQLGFHFIGIEKELEYYKIANKRIESVCKEKPKPLNLWDTL